MTQPGNFTDGNGIGGLLGEIFAAEPTAAERICQSCGARHPTGAHRAYAGAGTVLRCPSCGDVAIRVAQLPGRQLVEFRGTWIFEGPSPPTSVGGEHR
jgi:predicted RNA-binding Zn-ribbon protein involved in translation (DUF1610 family)